MELQRQYSYTKSEEVFNSISHGVGALLAVAGLVVMLYFSSGMMSVISTTIYGVSMIFMYSMSMTYHAVPFPKAKHVLKILDHASIYLLIAGCYSPFILILLKDSSRALGLFITVWIIAFIGIFLNVKDISRFKRIGLILYLLMGWLALLEIRNIVIGLGVAGTILFIAGGLSYTIGVIFYRMKHVRYMHGVWHIFVLAGSVFHYICILRYIILA